MSTLQTNFDAIKEAYKPIFEALERALLRFDIDFYLIGAQSRDVWTNHLEIKKKQTRDIDYAVFINDKDTWHQLNTYLAEAEKFERDKNRPYRFYYASLVIDILPFGGIEQNGEVTLDNPTTEISVYGCKEVMEDAIVIHDKYKVITLPGLCILKLIAHDEKPGRTKDWQDILMILENYFDITGDQLYDGNYEDLFESNNFNVKIASARMLGRHVQLTLQKNDKLRDKILSILNGKLMNFNFEEIEQMYSVKEADGTYIVTLRLLAELIKGIKD